MFNSHPYVLSIAGFDPSGGAGVLADVKTFEQNGATGMGAISALTYQNDIEFEKVEWFTFSQIIGQVEVLQKRFQFEYIKIGLIENLEILLQLIDHIITNPKSKIQNPKIIWDPILKASAGFEFHTDVNKELLEKICKQIYLITPNIPEALQLGGLKSAEKNAEYLGQFCNVYLKGGHSEKKGTDILFTTEGKQIEFLSDANNVFPKHGSGCVLSSAITAKLATGSNLERACKEAKKYTTDFLKSNESLLGSHSNLMKVEHG
ncbi:MAG: hydroxymethylpyrimidine/phosphomethylpyrimidine kinase [Bacteroidia bacterium]